MKKTKIILSSIFLALAGISIASSGLYYSEPTRVLATVSETDGSIDFGKYNERSTQETIETYGTLIQTPKNLFVEGDKDATKKLYTIRITNLGSSDGATTGYTYSMSDSTISVQQLASSDTSNRLPWLSHAFKLSDNLLQASKNGFLTVKVNANTQINSTNDGMKTILYNGILSSDATADFSEISAYDMEYVKQETDVQEHEVILNNATQSDYLIAFAMERIKGDSLGSGGWGALGRTLKLSVTAPTLTITSSDETAPSVEFTCDNTWKNTDKTLTIKVTDNESGIMSVVGANGEALTLVSGEGADDNHIMYYTMNIPENGDYSVVVTDNVGNTQTYTYTESHIDKTIPSKPIITGIPALSYNQDIAINLASWVQSGSEERVYYTIDGTTPTTASNTLTAGDNNITFPWKNDIEFKAVIIDEAGNTSEMFTSKLNVSKRHSFQVSSTHCTVVENIEPIVVDNYYMGERIALNFTAEEGYERRVIRINDNEYILQDDTYSLDITEDSVVEVIYVYSLKLRSVVTGYVFNNNFIKPSFSLNTDSSLDLDIVVNIKDTDQRVDYDKIKDAGEYTLTWSYYSYEFGGNGQFDFVIDKYSVAISVAEDQSKTYGDSDPESFLYTIGQLPKGVESNIVLTRDDGEDVGSYEIKLTSSSLDEKNYNITFNSENFTIYTRTIVVSVDSKTKVYGDEDPEFTYTVVDGRIVDGDQPVGVLTRVEGEDVDSYAITTSQADTNYKVLITPSYLTITEKYISVVINDVEAKYGKEEDLTYSVTGLVGDDELYGALTRAPGESVGSYAISLGTLHNDNYIITTESEAYYVIKPSKITVRANDVSKYYGDSDSLTYTAEGLLAGDILSGELKRDGGEAVGTYAINLGSLHNDNYDIDFVSATLTITPATLSVTIDDCYQVYGEIEKDLTYALSGLKRGDRVSLVLNRDEGEDVGAYAITCTLNNPNYTLDVTGGTYYITQATLVPTINSQKFVYSGNTNYVTSNFPYDLTFVYTSQDGIECNGMLNAGEYTVVARFAGNKNYIAKDSKVYTFVVEKQSVYLTITNSQFIYDGYPHRPEFTYNSACGLEEEKISFHFIDCDGIPSEIGSYDYTISCSDSNYSITTAGTMTIAGMFTTTNTYGSVLECKEATFDEESQDIVLLENHSKGKLNNEKIVNTCTFENASDSEYIYTAKVKSTSDSEKIHVYQLGKDGNMREIVVSLEDGYYVFKVDNALDTFVITREKEPLPAWFWLVLIGGGVVALVVTLQVVKTVRRKKLAKVNNASDLDTYNIN